MRMRAVLPLLTVLPMAAAAEPLPLPTADFSAAYTVSGGGMPASTMRISHGGGRVRMEFAMPGGMAATGYLDTATRKATMVMTLPGGGRQMAMEMDGKLLPKQFAAPEGRRLGPQRFAGEACDAFEHIEPNSGIVTVSCLTPDGIMLHSEARRGDEVVAVVEATEVVRARQDRGSLVPPKNVPAMKLPGGLIPGLPKP
jgi:hypothetical protein